MTNELMHHTTQFDIGYGVALGLCFSMFIFMFMFAVHAIIEKHKHSSLTFSYGTLSALFIILFNIYVIHAFDVQVMNAVPEWLLFIGKISIPLCVSFSYRTFVATLPVDSIETYLIWKRAEKSFLYFNILIAVSILFILQTDSPSMVLALSLFLSMCEHALALVVIKGKFKKTFFKQLHSIFVVSSIIIGSFIIVLLFLYGLQGVTHETFLIFNLGFISSVLLYHFVLIQQNLQERVNSEKNFSLLSDGFFKSIYTAIKKEEFFLLYQPKIDLVSKKACGVEALIRWQHGKKGLIPPDDFIPIAEKTDIINNICQWLITQVVCDVKKMRAKGIDIPVSINFSVVNFNPAMVEFLLQTLQKHNLPASSIIIEITESLFLDMNEELLKDINTLKEAGVGLSLDDFGAGHSSLRHLDKLPLCEVKIDKSLIKDIDNYKQKAVVNTLITMCHLLDLKVVAEGIEEEKTLQELLSLSCAMGQGYGICRPQKLELFIEWVQENLSNVSSE